MDYRGFFRKRLLVPMFLSPIGILGLAAAVSSCGPPPPLSTASAQGDDSFVEFDAEGRLIRPTGYRKWVYVGTPLTPNELNPPEAAFPDFHPVYIDPVSYDYYIETGSFRDGTVLVKELVGVGAKSAPSGSGYFMGEFIGLETTVKDSRRFPNEPGNWAYFSFGHSYPLSETAAAFPAGACNACHEASAEDDWVFTQYYPVLRATQKPKQTSTATRPSLAPSGVAVSMGDSSYDRRNDTMLGAQESAMQPTAPTAAVDSVVPTDRQLLFQFLQAGSYRTFSDQETDRHPSRGPHAKFNWPVRVFFDPKMASSLQRGNVEHPAGSAVVKEMFSEDGSNLVGWAVMVKTLEDSEGGAGWFWYETTNTEDSSDVVAAGNGIGLCVGCHATGNDFVLTSYPPRS